MLVESGQNVRSDFSNLLQQNLSAEALMVQVQLLMTKEFDEQLQDISQKIKFLNDVKKDYRENINVLRGLTAQDTHEKDGKRYVGASFEQMDEAVNALVEYKYDLENKEIKEKPMTDWKKYFFEGASTKDKEKRYDLAEKLNDKKPGVPFRWEGKVYEDGSPKLSIMVDAIDKMIEQINNFMFDLEEETEQLSVQINQLTSQRKTALEGASQILRKLEEVATNTVSKL